LEHVVEGKFEGREDEGENVSSYWMILRKQGDIANGKRKHQITLCGEMDLEEVVDLS
jgi:hypothetical protein